MTNQRLVDLAAQVIQEFPTSSNRMLGRLLAERHPTLFYNGEHGRSIIRYVRGASGEFSRRENGPYPELKRDTVPPPRTLPPSRTTSRDPFVLHHKKTLILSDTHIPYHDAEAIQVALDYREFDSILLNGDILDFHRLSRFVPDAEAVSFAEEIETGKEFLRYLHDTYGVPIYYKIGNHEERLEHYMYTKAPEIADTKVWRIEELLDFEELGITLISDKRRVLLGSLTVLHGHELSRGFVAPVNPARGAFLKASQSVLIGHHHKTSEHNETALGGKLISCWSTGCLCNLSPSYAPYNKSNLGFAFVEVSGDGYNVQNKRIHEGRIM